MSSLLTLGLAISQLLLLLFIQVASGLQRRLGTNIDSNELTE